MEPYTDILYTVANRMATITINRPKTLNAFTQHTIYEMEHAFRNAEADKNVGVIVFTGVGERSFSSGGDMKWEAEGGVEKEEYNLAHMAIASPKPVIARVNGYCIGGANHLAYFCDITIAAEHAIFGQNGPRVGSPPAGIWCRMPPTCSGTSALGNCGCSAGATPQPRCCSGA